MNVQVSARVEEGIRDRAEEVLAREGLDISTLLRMIVTKTANEQRVPIKFVETASFVRRRSVPEHKLAQIRQEAIKIRTSENGDWVIPENTLPEKEWEAWSL